MPLRRGDIAQCSLLLRREVVLGKADDVCFVVIMRVLINSFLMFSRIWYAKEKEQLINLLRDVIFMRIIFVTFSAGFYSMF